MNRPALKPGYIDLIRSVLRAFDFFFFVYLLLISLLTFVYRDSIPAAMDLLLRNSVVFLVVCLLIRYGENSSVAVLRFCRFWYFCAAIPIVFTEFSYVLHVVRPEDYDPFLIKLDFFLFGVHPTVWMERFVHPILTDILQALYVLYLPLPLPLGFLLYCSKREDEFYTFTTALSILYLVSFLGYLAVPAIGPRFTMVSYQHIQLRGRWCADALMALIDYLDGVNRDCFPSGHAAMAVIVCIESYLRGRKLFPMYLVVGTGVFIGTLYLRYHYAVDLVAGVLLAVFCCVASRRLVPWWERRIRKRSPLPRLVSTLQVQ